MKQVRTSADSQPFLLSWTATWAGAAESITDQADGLNNLLWTDLWGSLSSDTYPNVIAVDAFTSTARPFPALAMAVNFYMAPACTATTSSPLLAVVNSDAPSSVAPSSVASSSGAPSSVVVSSAAFSSVVSSGIAASSADPSSIASSSAALSSAISSSVDSISVEPSSFASSSIASSTIVASFSADSSNAAPASSSSAVPFASAAGLSDQIMAIFY